MIGKPAQAPLVTRSQQWRKIDMQQSRTVLEIVQANFNDLNDSELRVREAFVDFAEIMARYNDVLAHGYKHGFRLAVSKEILDAMRNFQPHFGQIDSAVTIFETMVEPSKIKF
ncbi:hypothetical protein ACO0LB_17925 [Undibacterium sp. SXout7W]|uniref:hypothetical protein n=1 Tax=Undibacterium sp. SXout7W TaxID=3413049 RepID=UPI003BF129C1